VSPSPLLVRLDLVAVVVAVTNNRPRVMTMAAGTQLPAGALDPTEGSLQTGMRRWVEATTGLTLGYAEQLYTFNDRGVATGEPPHISIGYMGLAREQPDDTDGWRDWYDYFPWEDLRHGTPAQHVDFVRQLRTWADAKPAERAVRRERVTVAFGLDGVAWNEEMILQRYELLYEAGLLPESDPPVDAMTPTAVTGWPMRLDHRRVLATGIARLRAKIKYRPVVFELLPDAFTLFQLQQTVEALAGRAVHKPNFRRLMAQQNLIEETEQMITPARGRPARLHRFRREVLSDRAVAGTLLPRTR
jgi:hypothetical protein